MCMYIDFEYDDRCRGTDLGKFRVLYECMYTYIESNIYYLLLLLYTIHSPIEGLHCPLHTISSFSIYYTILSHIHHTLSLLPLFYLLIYLYYIHPLPNLPLYNNLHSTTAELSAALKEAEECRDALDRFKDIVKDEIIATKETYFAIHSHCYETEVCMCV